MDRRVVVTGVGLSTALGCDVESFWSLICAGKVGTGLVTRFKTDAFRRSFGGEIHCEKDKDDVRSREDGSYGRATKLGISACQRAFEDASIGVDAMDSRFRDVTSVVIGTTFGEIEVLERIRERIFANNHSEQFSPDDSFKLRQYAPNSLAANIAQRYRFGGAALVLPTACAAGNYAVGLGAQLIASGRAQTVVAGGVDPFSRMAFAGFARLGVMALERCQPFDLNRKGMLVGEGAGMIVLEELKSARARGARIYAEVLGLGVSCDARHMTIPSLEGMKQCMQMGLERSGLSSRDIDYICAHGTGTVMNDKTESAAVRDLFYNRGHQVPISSIKSMLGHSMGAASAIETIACVLAIREGVIPPTANFETRDPECDVDCVPNTARKAHLRFVMNNAFAFGGNNAALVLGSVN